MTHNYQTASVFKRIIAYLIDAILVGMVVCAFLFQRMGKSDENAFVDEGKPSIADEYQFFSYLESIIYSPNRGLYVEKFLKNYPAEFIIGLLLFPLVYFVFFEGLWGGSIGKLITGIRVRRKDGGKINFGIALVRHLASIISTIIFFLGYALALIDNKKQTLHDKIANTLVLNKGTGI